MIWLETHVGHLHDKLKMKGNELYPCVSYRKDSNCKVDGLQCLKLDNSIGSDSQELIAEELKASKCFKNLSLEFLEIGVELELDEHYIKRNATKSISISISKKTEYQKVR